MSSIITVGDYVTHKQYDWYGELKVTAINFNVATLEFTNKHVVYHSLTELTKVSGNWKHEYFGSDFPKRDSIYCDCSYTDKKIVKSSIQVQGAVEEKDKFDYCRTCKKEAK